MYFFFFQAEDGIRDLTVTGVQTCALPISPKNAALISLGGSAYFISLPEGGKKITVNGEVVHGKKRSEEHTSELQSQSNLVCRLLLEKKKIRSETRSMPGGRRATQLRSPPD